MKCANCDSPALYVYEGPGIRPAGYCGDDLPRFLHGAARSGNLRTTEDYDALKKSAMSALSFRTVTVDPETQPTKKKRSRKSAPKDPEPVVEAPVEEPQVEEAPVEEPAQEPSPEEPTEPAEG